MAVETIRQIEPAAHLRPWISEIRVGVASPGRPYRLTRLPNGEATLLFRATGEKTGELTVSGPLQHARYKIAQTIPFFVRVSLRPGRARQVLGCPLYELADRIFPLDDIWNSFGRTLCARLMDGGPDRAITIVEDALIRVISSRDRKSPIVSQIVQAMDNDTFATVDDYAGLAGLSPRQLRRLFQLELGIGPKRYIRIVRLRRLLSAAHAKVSWADLASKAGFYDQAHLISDFKELVHATPEAFLARRTEYVRCH